MKIYFMSKRLQDAIKSKITAEMLKSGCAMTLSNYSGYNYANNYCKNEYFSLKGFGKYFNALSFQSHFTYSGIKHRVSIQNLNLFLVEPKLFKRA